MTQILDDSSSSSTKIGNWTKNTGKGYGNTFSTANPTPTEIAAAWNFTVQPIKKYQIAVTYVVDDTMEPNASNAVYSILDGGRLVTTVSVNQQDPPVDFMEGGVGWKNLGIVMIYSPNLKVRLSNRGADGQIVADACRIQWPPV